MLDNDAPCTILSSAFSRMNSLVLDTAMLGEAVRVLGEAVSAVDAAFTSLFKTCYVMTALACERLPMAARSSQHCTRLQREICELTFITFVKDLH